MVDASTAINSCSRRMTRITLNRSNVSLPAFITSTGLGNIGVRSTIWFSLVALLNQRNTIGEVHWSKELGSLRLHSVT